jgi:hypothetical protein
MESDKLLSLPTTIKLETQDRKLTGNSTNSCKLITILLNYMWVKKAGFFFNTTYQKCKKARWLIPVILTTQDTKNRRTTVQGQSRQKLVRPHKLNKKAGMGMLNCNTCYMGGIGRRITV